MQWASRIYKEQAPLGNPLWELGDSEGTAGEDKFHSSVSREHRHGHIFTCGSHGHGWALEHTVIEGSGAYSWETQLGASGALGAWTILVTGLGRVFILRIGTYLFI